MSDLPEQSVPVTTAADAVVNNPPPVELYSQDGRPVTVAFADVDYWLTHGLTREKHDPVEAGNEFSLLCDSTKAAVEAYLKVVIDDGIIDQHEASAMAVAEQAMEDLTQCWDRLHSALHARFPIKQGTGVRMRATEDIIGAFGLVQHAAGSELEVDTSQVEFWQGFKAEVV